MLLSEAMRFGAMLGPQCGLDLVNGNRSCAFGSAGLALGVRFRDGMDYAALYRVFPSLEHSKTLKTEVWERNDQLAWTREEIADWLVESGNDCESVETAPASEIAAALISQHMVAR